jgi:hypothetical protein
LPSQDERKNFRNKRFLDVVQDSLNEEIKRKGKIPQNMPNRRMKHDVSLRSTCPAPNADGLIIKVPGK